MKWNDSSLSRTLFLSPGRCHLALPPPPVTHPDCVFISICAQYYILWKKIHFHQCFKSISTVKLYLFQKGKFGGDLFYFYRQKCIFALWYIFFPFLYIVYQIQHQVQFSWFLCSLTFGPSLSFFVCLLVLLSGSVLNHRSMHVYHITASLSAQNRPNYSSVWQRPRQKPLCYLCVCVHVWAWICAVKPE